MIKAFHRHLDYWERYSLHIYPLFIWVVADVAEYVLTLALMLWKGYH